MSSLCVHCCCYCCLQCCGEIGTSKKLEYAGIEYDPTTLTGMTGFTEPPLGRSFHFPQPGRELSVPQLAAHTVTEQPSQSKPSRLRAVSLPANALHSKWGVLEQASPSLRFSLYYDIQRRTLTVNLEKASNLPAKDRSGTSDPFVVMYLVPNKEQIFESKVVYKTLHPVFEQTFEFHNLQSDDIRRQSLVFRVYNYCKFTRNDPIGGIIIPLEDADLYGVVHEMTISERMEAVKSNSRGDLHISLSYYPKESVLKGVILKATNLKKDTISELADPYVKVYLVHQGRRIAKWKTSVRRNTLAAVFNEPFRFDLEKRDINNISLEVRVMDYDRLNRDAIMGVVLLGGSVRYHSGRSHWAEMVASSWQSITQWHSIRPVSAQEAQKKKTIHS